MLVVLQALDAAGKDGTIRHAMSGVNPQGVGIFGSGATDRSTTGNVGLATGLVVALFPFAAIGGGLLAATTGGGAVLGAVAGHAAAGMSRDDLKELGESLDAGQAGLVVVAVSDRGARVERARNRAAKLHQKELKADTGEIERDAASAGQSA